MLKIRIKFQKYGIMKFIGHLDVMRYFQKAIRRAQIDIAYSGGYSPHQIMSFAAPLGVGLTSDGEYLDIEVNETKSSEESVEALNRVGVEGIHIVSYRLLEDKAPNAMSIVAAADYRVSFREGKAPQGWQEKLMEFYSQPELVITKKTKKSEREVDLKPLIYSLAVEDDNIYMRLCTGSVENVKPELVMEAFYHSIGVEMPEFALLIHRQEIYADMGDEGEHRFVSLEELGDIIE